MKFSKVEEVFDSLPKKPRIVTGMAASEPQAFFENLAPHLNTLQRTVVHCANPMKPYPCFTSPEFSWQLELEVMFLTAHVRKFQGFNLVHYIPQHLSRWSENLRRRGKIDVFWGSCSLPNENGEVSLGPGCCYESEILACADVVVLEVNRKMPFTFGASVVKMDEVDFFVKNDHELPCLDECKSGEVDAIIAQHVSSLVPDGATIQLGIGSIPNAIGFELCKKQNLGIHTELFTESMMRLVACGAANNSQKTKHVGKAIASFVLGTPKLYEYVNHNPALELLPSSYVNDPYIIAQNTKMFSINSAVEIDLTGQVCSESIGHQELSGVGGAADTHVGASRSDGGMGIIAIHAASSDLRYSKIVFELKPGAKVSVSRNDVDTIVTEYGVAHLRGLSVGDRARALIAIAHPHFRDELRYQAKQVGYI